MNNWFKELSAVDVNGHTREKNGLTYLSWMWAWAELKKRYPLSYATVHETEDGMLVWKDPVGCHVKTSVTIVWEDKDVDGKPVMMEHTVTEYLPVMDFKNKAMQYDNVDAMVVNKTVQRSLTKCIARLGIGGYIYMSEDLPEESKELDKLKAECMDLISKRSKLSDKTKDRVAEICKELLPSENGDPRICENSELLAILKKKLMATRKIAD